MSAVSFRRGAAVWALVFSGLLMVVGFFMDPDIDAEGRELAQAYAENPERIQVSAHALRLAFVLLMVPVFVIVGIVRERGAWLGNVAGALAIFGLTMSGLLVVDFYDVAIYGELGGDAWQAVSDRLEELPGMALLFISSFVPLLLALPLALLAAWRGGLMPWWPGALALAGPVVGEVLPAGLGLLLWAAVLVLLGYVLHRPFQHPAATSSMSAPPAHE